MSLHVCHKSIGAWYERVQACIWSGFNKVKPLKSLLQRCDLDKSKTSPIMRQMMTFTLPATYLDMSSGLHGWRKTVYSWEECWGIIRYLFHFIVVLGITWRNQDCQSSPMRTLFPWNTTQILGMQNYFFFYLILIINSLFNYHRRCYAVVLHLITNTDSASFILKSSECCLFINYGADL